MIMAQTTDPRTLTGFELADYAINWLAKTRVRRVWIDREWLHAFHQLPEMHLAVRDGRAVYLLFGCELHRRIWRDPGLCVCQGDDPVWHKHYPDPPHACARCGHTECPAWRSVSAAKAGRP